LGTRNVAVVFPSFFFPPFLGWGWRHGHDFGNYVGGYCIVYIYVLWIYSFRTEPSCQDMFCEINLQYLLTIAGCTGVLD